MAQEFLSWELVPFMWELDCLTLYSIFFKRSLVFLYFKFTRYFFPSLCLIWGCRETELARGLTLSAASSVILTGREDIWSAEIFHLVCTTIKKGFPVAHSCFCVVLFPWGNGSGRKTVWSPCWVLMGTSLPILLHGGNPGLPAMPLGCHHVA